MRFAHLLAEFYFNPWALRPDYHSNFGMLLQADVNGTPDKLPEQAFSTRRAPFEPGATSYPIVGPVDRWGQAIVPQMTSENGVAVVPVWGALGKRLSFLELLCGGVDYDHLSQFAEMARADKSVHTVAFDFDTPGGSCRGLPECAAVFAELSAEKQTIGYTEGLCCSAGYYLACMLNEFHASPSASVGNIGTVLAAVDKSREWEMKGWRLELFASGALKGVGFEGKQWTDTEREFFREWMMKKTAEFHGVVREHRPQVSEVCFDARWIDGDIAPDYGLTDGVVSGFHNIVAAAIQAGGK